ncbi:DUF3093 domain-containing protein [Microbacterium allomyrinae]|uniref:DUF3093 domain-containing protein n=1 Tax=Microbacterium allomyrinae TaxID=2830666 RepID=A0A9X1LUQ4_9MICO|nr:DUF3093 domain-containing protein [Microbacterium allomyrinae]MCC2032161.1 DUF3093 domain-containing protein [Microbacterium allomyrinae]
MQKTARKTRADVYRERLGPSLWILVSAAVVAPMTALVVTPIDTTLALAIGVGVGVVLIVLLLMASPVVEVRDGELRAGRAHIDVEFLGEPEVHVGDDARHARGAGLDPRSWHLIRGGIDGVVVTPVADPDDPTTMWVISSRTPDRLSAALRRAQATRSTPRR